MILFLYFDLHDARWSWTATFAFSELSFEFITYDLTVWLIVSLYKYIRTSNCMSKRYIPLRKECEGVREIGILIDQYSKFWYKP